jgi:hypothetical protein
MAKPLSAKGLVIRAAIQAHPELGNTKLAELINDSPDPRDDNLKVTVSDVATQRQALKKAAAGSNHAASPATKPVAAPARPRKQKRKGGRKARARVAANATPAVERQPVVAPAVRPVELLGKVFDLATEVGGFGELKQLVDRLAGIEKK